MKRCQICKKLVPNVTVWGICSVCTLLKEAMDELTPTGIKFFYGYSQRLHMDRPKRRRKKNLACTPGNTSRVSDENQYPH